MELTMLSLKGSIILEIQRRLPMINNSNRSSTANVQFTWQDLLWRLVLTGLLLLLLGLSSLTIFGSITTRSNTQVLPLTQEVESGPFDVER